MSDENESQKNTSFESAKDAANPHTIPNPEETLRGRFVKYTRESAEASAEGNEINEKIAEERMKAVFAQLGKKADAKAHAENYTHKENQSENTTPRKTTETPNKGISETTDDDFERTMREAGINTIPGGEASGENNEIPDYGTFNAITENEYLLRAEAAVAEKMDNEDMVSAIEAKIYAAEKARGGKNAEKLEELAEEEEEEEEGNNDKKNGSPAQNKDPDTPNTPVNTSNTPGANSNNPEDTKEAPTNELDTSKAGAEKKGVNSGANDTPEVPNDEFKKSADSPKPQEGNPKETPPQTKPKENTPPKQTPPEDPTKKEGVDQGKKEKLPQTPPEPDTSKKSASPENTPKPKTGDLTNGEDPRQTPPKQATIPENVPNANATKSQSDEKIPKLPGVGLRASREGLKNFEVKDSNGEVLRFRELSEGKQTRIIEAYKQLRTEDTQATALGEFREKQGELAKKANLNWKKPVRFLANLVVHAPTILQMTGRSMTQGSKTMKRERELQKQIFEGKVDDNELLTEVLRQVSAGPEIDIDKNGKMETRYVGEDFLGADSTAEKRLVLDINEAASAFQSVPSEWKNAKKGSEHYKAYKKAEEKLAHEKDKYLEELGRTGKETQVAQKAFAKMDMQMHMDRLLNANPDLEKELLDTQNKNLYFQAGKDLARTRGKYFAFGAATRTAAIAGLGVATIGGGWLVAPAVSVLGNLVFKRGKKRGEKELSEREQISLSDGGAPSGNIYATSEQVGANATKKEKRDAQKQADKDLAANFEKSGGTIENITNAGGDRGLTSKLEKLLDELENAPDDNDLLVGDSPEHSVGVKGNRTRKQVLASLSARIAYTRRKLDEEKVSFGKGADCAKNIYHLNNALSKAMAEDYVSTNRTEIEKNMDTYLDIRSAKIDRAKKRYLKKKLYQGATFAASYTLFGEAVAEGAYLAGEATGDGNIEGGGESAPNENDNPPFEIYQESNKEGGGDISETANKQQEMLAEQRAAARIDENNYEMVATDDRARDLWEEMGHENSDDLQYETQGGVPTIIGGEKVPESLYSPQELQAIEGAQKMADAMAHPENYGNSVSDEDFANFINKINNINNPSPTGGDSSGVSETTAEGMPPSEEELGGGAEASTGATEAVPSSDVTPQDTPGTVADSATIASVATPETTDTTPPPFEVYQSGEDSTAGTSLPGADTVPQTTEVTPSSEASTPNAEVAPEAAETTPPPFEVYQGDETTMEATSPEPAYTPETASTPGENIETGTTGEDTTEESGEPFSELETEESLGVYEAPQSVEGIEQSIFQEFENPVRTMRQDNIWNLIKENLSDNSFYQSLDSDGQVLLIDALKDQAAEYITENNIGTGDPNLIFPGQELDFGSMIEDTPALRSVIEELYEGAENAEASTVEAPANLPVGDTLPQTGTPPEVTESPETGIAPEVTTEPQGNPFPGNTPLENTPPPADAPRNTPTQPDDEWDNLITGGMVA